MLKSGSDFRFEPEPDQTERKVQFGKFLNLNAKFDSRFVFILNSLNAFKHCTFLFRRRKIPIYPMIPWSYWTEYRHKLHWSFHDHWLPLTSSPWGLPECLITPHFNNFLPRSQRMMCRQACKSTRIRVCLSNGWPDHARVGVNICLIIVCATIYSFPLQFI
jgi:hypothetical protein